MSTMHLTGHMQPHNRTQLWRPKGNRESHSFSFTVHFVFWDGLGLTRLDEASWPASSNLPVSASPVLWLQLHSATPGFVILILGVELVSSHLYSKHSTKWAITSSLHWSMINKSSETDTGILSEDPRSKATSHWLLTSASIQNWQSCLQESPNEAVSKSCFFPFYPL